MSLCRMVARCMSGTPGWALPINLLALAILLGCDKGVEPYPTRGSIVINEGIDGVRFGDDEATVKRKLGQPSSIMIGDFNGVGYEYTTGRYAKMYVGIYSPTATPSGVFSISVTSPYPGTTKEGIGIGSRRASVLDIFGQPAVHNQADSTSWDRYEFGAHLFLLEYRNDFVEWLTIGLKI